MSEENLYNQEAILKLKELAESLDFNLMATNLKKFPIESTPMSTKKVCEQGNIWFLSANDSQHNKNIKENSKVMLSYANKGSMEFLVVNGNASISKDKSVIDELYSKPDDMWFEGKDDPNVSVIKVKPADIKYWDTKHSKIVTLLKFTSGLITGDQPDIMEQGKLEV